MGHAPRWLGNCGDCPSVPYAPVDISDQLPTPTLRVLPPKARS